MITQYVTGQRTATCINLGVDLHGHTRSKELVDMWHRAGIIISYADVQLLYDKWALEDLNESLNVPREIAHGVATICIVDNDDFKIDTLTGKSQQAHRTNVMFVQPQRIERNVNIENSSRKNKAEISKELKQKAAELTSVTPYRAAREVSSEPPIRKFSVPPVEGPLPQQRRSVIHALVRVDCNGDRPEVDQQHVPSYSGMQACLKPRFERSKPYYQSTYPEPPSKSVMNDIMLKLVQGMKEKEIPFALLVGDLPTYVHIVEMKAENTESFKEIIPIFGPFHQQCSFIYAIYKRFRGSGISDVLVSAGVIVEGSVDQALRGKHYRRGVRCIMLMREVLIHSRIKELLSTHDFSETTENHLITLRSALNESQENLAAAHDSLEQDEDLHDIVNMCTNLMAQIWETSGCPSLK